MLLESPCRTVQKNAASVLKEIDILYGRTEVTRNLLALFEKYSPGAFTIATSDGLTFASQGRGYPIDAPICCMMINHNPLLTTPLVITSGLPHKGSDLVGVIRTHNPVSEDFF
jgi:hypothetical protein